MDKGETRRQRFVEALTEKQTHYRLYKSRHGWLVMGITTIALAAGLALTPQVVKADEQAVADPGVTESVDSSGTDNTSSDPVSDPVTTAETTATDSGTTDSAPGSGDAASVSDPASVVDNSTTESQPANGSEANTSDPTPAPSVSEPVTPPAPASDSGVTDPPVPAPASTDTTGSQASTSGTPSGSSNGVNDTSAPTSSDTSNTAQSTDSAGVVQDPTTPNGVTLPDDVAQPVPLALADVVAPKTVIPAPTTPDSAIIKAQFQADGLTLNTNSRETPLSPDGLFHIVADAFTVTVPPTSVQTPAIAAWLKSPPMLNYNISISNMRLVDGHWETTTKSVVTITVPPQRLVNNTGYVINATPPQPIPNFSGISIQAGPQNTDGGISNQVFLDSVNWTSIPNSNDVLISGTKTFTFDMSKTGTLGLNIRNQYWMIANGYISWIPWVSLGIVTAPVSYQLEPTINAHAPGDSILSGTGTAEGDWINVISRETGAVAQTKVDANGNWSIDRVKMGFSASDHLYVVENNDLGDTPGAVADPVFQTSYQNIEYTLDGTTIGTKQQTMNWSMTPAVNFVAFGNVTFTDTTWAPVGDGMYPAVDSPASPDPNYYPEYATYPTEASLGAGVNNDVEVKYLYKWQTVGPDDEDPQVPGLDMSQLKETVTQTISFVSNTGDSLMTSVTQELDFTRSAVINLETNTFDHYTDWVPVTTGTFEAYQRPLIDGYFTPTLQIDALTVDGTNQNLTAELVYFPRDIEVNGTDPKDSGTPIDETYPDGPKFSTGTTTTDLNWTKNWTVQYVAYNDLNTPLAAATHQSESFTRNATVHFDLDGKVSSIDYSDWTLSGKPYTTVSNFPNIRGFLTTQTSIDPPTVTPPADASNSGQTQTDYIKYYPSNVVVQPPAQPDDPLTVTPGGSTVPGDDQSPKYPDDLQTSDFVKTITRTINFILTDGQQSPVPPEVQEVSYKRTVSYNFAASLTNPSISYGDWEPYDTTAFAEFTNPIIKGYFPKDLTVPALQTSANDGNFSVDVHYYPDTVQVSGSDPKPEGEIVFPTNTEGPTYPAGVDTADLTLTVPVVIHYVEGVDLNNPLLDPTTQQVTFTRDATIKFAQDGTPTITYDAYQPDSQSSAGLATIPEVGGWVATVTDLPGIEVKPDSGKLDQYVKYYRAVVVVQPPATPDGEITVTPGANTEPDADSPKYPAVIDKAEFVNTVTRTIQYLDASTGDLVSSPVTQALSFKRTVGFNYTDDVLNPVVFYGTWEPYTKSQFEAVASPTIAGYFTLQKQVDVEDAQAETQPNGVIVLYYPDTVNVPSTDPKTPDDLIDPNNPAGPKYPAGVDQNDLNDTVNVTIHFVDARDQSIELQPAVTQAVNFARDATVHFDQDGNATVTYTDWTPASAQNDGLATLPSIDGYVTTQTKLDGLTVKAQDTDGNQYVLYYPVKVTVEAPVTPDGELAVKPGDPTVPGDDQAPKYPADLKADDLVSAVQRIIHYTDEAGVPVIKDAVQTVFFKRSVTYDYTDPENSVPTFGAWEPYTDGSFEAVPSPVLADWFTATTVVPAKQATAEAAPIVETVIYSQRFVTVQPDGPYIGNTSKDLMNQEVKQTIHYLKPDGSYAIQDRITTLEFTRTATVNAETGEVIAWGSWTPTTTDTFDELVSPTFPDLFTDTKVIAATTVKAEDGDIEETVQYDPLFVTVPPDGPYIGETSKELLNTETTMTIHYVDKDGNQVAEDHTAVLAFTRTATVNVETEKVESYSAWQPVTTDSFDAVVSPVLPDLFTVDKTVGPTKVTDPEKPIVENVVYNDLYLVVEPDGPYVGGTSQELQNKTVTQTIHYVKADGSEAAPDHVATLAFTRTAIINVETDTVDHFGDWQAVTTDTFDAVISPEVADQFTKEKQIDAAQVTAETIDLVETVHYNDLYVVVQAEGPDYLGNTSKDDLNESVTQTIHYVDENGVTVSPDASKTLTFTRTATINAETGEIVSHTDWVPVTTDTFEAVTSPSVDNLYTSQKMIDAVTVKADAVDINEDVVYHPLIVAVGPDGPYVGDTSKELLNQEVVRTIHYVDEAGKSVADDSVKSLAFSRTVKVNAETGEIVDEGTWTPTTTDTFDAVDSPTFDNLYTDQKQVNAVSVTALQNDITETVTYKDLYVTVKPDGPYIGEATKDALNQQVNRTIHYVDAQGNTVAPDHTDTLFFTRTVIVNAETGVITDQGTWMPTTTDTFGEVVSPTLPNLYTTDKQVDAIQVKAGDADLQNTVTYNDLYITILPNGPDYPGDSAYDQLNHTVTQTIHYVKADGSEAAPDSVKTLTFTRTAKFNVETQKVESYSDWVAVDGDTFAEVKSPDVKDQFTTTKAIAETKVTAETTDIEETVHYNDLYQVVQPEGPDYPGDTTKDLLNKTITSTIHYLKADGSIAAKDDVQTLAFKRTATINAETGAIESLGDWQAVDGDTFKDVESPILTDEFTTDKIVKGQQVTADSANPETTVQYQTKFVIVQPEGPDYPGDSSQDVLNKTITQTIHYVDGDGNEVAKDNVATLDFTRTAKVDLETGEVVEWGTWQPKTTDTFVEVVSPTVTDLTPDKKQIVATKVTGESEDITETVTYSSLYATVEPDGPFIGQTSEDKLNQTVTQTIHYVLPDGSVAAPDAVKTLAFKRTAQVNVETGEILSYGDWEALTTDTFEAVVSPTLANLFTTTKQVDAVKVDGDTKDLVETVNYQDLYVIVKPGDGYPNDPTLGDTIEHNLIVDTIRVIKYVDEAGNEVAPEYSTRLTFQRNAKVNVETNTVEEYTPWDPLNDTFPEVQSPDVANMFTEQKTANAIPIEPGAEDISETVTYKDLYVTVNPEGPTYPDGVTKDDLNQSVMQTIHYVKADGTEAAPDHLVTLDFTRTAKYNVETGKVESYSDWTAVNGDTFAEVKSPEVSDQFTTTKQIDAKTVKATDDDITETVQYNDLFAVVQPDGPYTGEATKEALNESVTATIHYLKADGTQAAKDDVQTLAFKRTATVNVETGKIEKFGDWQPVTTDTFDDVVSPILTDEFTTDKTVTGKQVTADTADFETNVQYQAKFAIVQPDGPDYPGESSQNALNKTVTQTIHYVDVDGKTVAKDNVATLDFTRTAKVDLETGKIVEFGDWQPKRTDSFAEVFSPTVENLTPDYKQIDPVKVSLDDPQDVATTVTYSNLYVTVQPEGPDYPGESSADKLNHTVTQTIHYVKADGSVAAPDSVQTLAFKRTAQVNVETGEILSYGDWQPVTTDSFDAVKSPDVPDQFTKTKQIDAVKVNGDSTDIVETVKYQDLFVDVNPDGPYVGDATKDYLNQSVTNTIHYVDADGKTVAEDVTQTLGFTRSATVNVETGKVVNTTDWKPVTTDTFDDVTSPILDNLFTKDKVVEGAQVKAEDADLEITVTYNDLYLVVQPDGPDYPAGTSKEDLNQSVTRTIHYVNENGDTVSPDVTKTLNFTRTATINVETGAVVSHTDWQATTTDTFDQVVSPEIADLFTSQKAIDAVTVKADAEDITERVVYKQLIVTVQPDGPFIGETNKALLNQSVTQTIHYVDASGNTVVPDATKTLNFTRTATVNAETGKVISKSDWQPVTTDTFDAVTSPVLDDWFTTTKQIDAAKVDAEHTDIVENVVYNKLFITVNPDGPYTGDATKDYLNQSVTNTIHYVDSKGNSVFKDDTETLAFTRTATVNVETGEIVNHTDWKPVTTDTFADVLSPTLDNLFTTDKLVKGVQVKAEDADPETTVVYKDLYVTVKPEGPDYPVGVSKDDLNQTVTETIHYVKADGSEAAPDYVKSLAFTRTAKYNLETGKVEDYSEWTAVDGDTFAEIISPDVPDQFTTKKQIDEVKVTAETPDIEETVAYSDLIVTVEPDGPYIGDTNQELLNQFVTRTIHYVDADGNSVAPDVTETLDFTRTATVNAETGEVISKSDWQPVTTDTFEAVENPDVNDMYTTDDPIEAVQVAAEDDDLEATITYKDLYLIVKPEGPDYPDGISKEDLNQEVTQTIHYVDEEGKPVASDHQITLKFTRTAKVNVLTGEVTYSDWQAVTTDTFVAVPNPILKGYTTDANEVESQTVTAESADQLTTVIYKAITTPTPTPKPQPEPQQPAPDQGTTPAQQTPAPNTKTQPIGPAVITPASAGTTNDQMPTTSDAQNTKLSLMGLILASFATVGAWFTTRKHKKGARH